MAQNQTLSNFGQYIAVNTSGNTVTFNTTAVLNGVSANGSYGTAGQALTTNGTAVYWSTIVGTNTSAQYVWTNAHTFQANVTFTGNVSQITANGSVGTNNQVLTSNGTNIYWATPTGGLGATFSFVYNTFTGNGSVNTYTLTAPATTNNALVYINGVYQQPSNAYSITGTTLTFTANVPNNAIVSVEIPSYQTFSGTVSGYINYYYTATAGQTTFSGNDNNSRSLKYDPTYLQVFLNGVKLPGADYTATSGNSIVLSAAASLNDVVEIISFGALYATNNAVYIDNVVTTSNTSTWNVDSFSATTYRSASYQVQVTDNTNSNYHVENINLVHNGSSVWMTEYGAVYSNGSSLASFDATINTGILYLQVTPVTANSTVRVLRTAVAV